MTTYRFLNAMFGALICLGLIVCSSHAEQERGMGIHVEALPKNLQKMDIKDHFISSSSREVGILHALNGHVVVIHRADNQAYFGKQGDEIYENDEFYTLDNTRCRIRFFSDDVVSLGADTHFAVEDFDDDRNEGEKSAFFSMLKGKALFYALRLFQYKNRRFEIKTPTAVVGVRGTKFGANLVTAEIEKQSSWLSNSETNKVSSSNQANQYFVKNSVFYCTDGVLQIKDKIVQPGEKWDNGQVVPYSEQELIEFEKSVLVLARDGTKRDVADENGEIDDDLFYDEYAELYETIINTTLNETEAQSIEFTEETSLVSLAEPLYGYFAVLLSRFGSADCEDVFLQTSEYQETTGTNVKAWGVDQSSYYIVYNDETESIEKIDLGLGEETINILITSNDKKLVGQVDNAYQWGYWLGSSQRFDYNGTEFAFDQKSWWIEGYPTSMDILAQRNGKYSYKGDVYGTYWKEASSLGGVDLEGGFSCLVDFTTKHVSDFQMEVLGITENSYGAKVEQSIAADIVDGQFYFDDSLAVFYHKSPSTGGVWNPADGGRVSGTFYGNNADMGFAWGIHKDGINESAGGIGHGSGRRP